MGWLSQWENVGFYLLQLKTSNLILIYCKNIIYHLAIPFHTLPKYFLWPEGLALIVLFGLLLCGSCRPLFTSKKTMQSMRKHYELARKSLVQTPKLQTVSAIQTIINKWYIFYLTQCTHTPVLIFTLFGQKHNYKYYICLIAVKTDIFSEIENLLFVLHNYIFKMKIFFF